VSFENPQIISFYVRQLLAFGVVVAAVVGGDGGK